MHNGKKVIITEHNSCNYASFAHKLSLSFIRKVKLFFLLAQATQQCNTTPGRCHCKNTRPISCEGKNLHMTCLCKLNGKVCSLMLISLYLKRNTQATFSSTQVSHYSPAYLYCSWSCMTAHKIFLWSVEPCHNETAYEKEKKKCLHCIAYSLVALFFYANISKEFRFTSPYSIITSRVNHTEHHLQCTSVLETNMPKSVYLYILDLAVYIDGPEAQASYAHCPHFRSIRDCSLKWHFRVKF